MLASTAIGRLTNPTGIEPGTPSPSMCLGPSNSLCTLECYRDGAMMTDLFTEFQKAHTELGREEITSERVLLSCFFVR